MKRLVLVRDSGPKTGREHALESGELTLGRDEGSDVRYEPDEGGVSRHHATIRAQEDRFLLTDLKSANGTYLGAERVESAWLKNGDVITLGNGGPRLRVELSEISTTPAQGTVLKPKLSEMTLYNPDRHREPPKGGVLGIVVVVGMMFAGLGAGLLVALISVFELGLGVALVGVFVAFAAAPVYIMLWLWLDRYDPEPAWAIAGALLWGAGAATFISVIVNSLFQGVMTKVAGDAALAEAMSASISAPFVEEAAKGLAVLLIFLVLRREFDGVLDGIVYAGIVALGFAATENVLYYGRSLHKGGAGALIVVFIIRGILGPFSHAVFTSMTGIGCGIARTSHNMFVRFAAPIAGYGVAVFLHFLWNTLAWVFGTPGGILLIYVVLWVPLFFVFLGFVIWMGHRESVLIARMLKGEVGRGLLTEKQAAIVASWPKRVGFILGSLGNLTKLRARRGFLRASTRLALSYWHAERAAAAGGQTVSAGLIPVFRNEVSRLQPQV